MSEKTGAVYEIKAVLDVSDVKSNSKVIQNSLKGIKLPDSMKGVFSSLFSELDKELDSFETKMQQGFENAGDVKSLEKSAKNITKIFNSITKEVAKVETMDLSKLINFDSKEIKEAQAQIKELKKAFKEKIAVGGLTEAEAAVKSISKVSKNQNIEAFFNAFKSGDIEAAEKHLNAFAKTANSFKAENSINTFNSSVKQMREALEKLKTQSGLDEVKNDLKAVETVLEQLEADEIEKLSTNIRQLSSNTTMAAQSANNYTNSTIQATKAQKQFNDEIDEIKDRVKYFFTLANGIELFKRAVRDAYETVKELDAAMTETAVVTDFSVGDMWDKLPLYAKSASELGATLQGAYETMTLFYQQGLDTNQAFALGTETMKMARIAGLEYKDATDLMTAALRGFDMELNEINATRVNDVVSELAAVTAADTQEILTAMSKTASIAHSANMEYETTAALLSQIIETTREPAETAGTAMKTIIARFTEMKEATSDLINVDGEEVSVNKVEAALKTAGVALRDAKGEFRDLDDVFLELSSKWDTLDVMTQRYIATMAAGSRQQSRFIAMMQNYERTMELVNAAYSSTGASAQQFSKTQESLEAKINRLKTAWQQFTMGIANNKAIKAAVDLLTLLLETINKVTDSSNGLVSSIGKIGVAFAGFKIAKKGFSGIENVITNILSKSMTKAGLGAGEDLGDSVVQGATGAINKNKKGFGQMFSNLVMKTSISTEGYNFVDVFKENETALDSFAQKMQAAYGAGVPERAAAIKSFKEISSTMNLTSEQAARLTQGYKAGASSLGAYTFAITGNKAALKGGLDETTAAILLEAKLAEERGDTAKATALTSLAEKGLAQDRGASNITSFASNIQGATDKINNFTDLINKSKGAAGGLKGTFKGLGGAVKNSFKGMGGAVKGFGGALGGLASALAPLLTVAAIIAGVAVGIGLAHKQANKYKEELADSETHLQKAKEAADNAKKSYDDLLASIESYKEGQKALASLEKGTAEWRNQLIETNQIVLDLIEKYPELIKNAEYFKKENGELILTEAGQQYAAEMALKQKNNAIIGQSLATVGRNQRQKEAYKEEIEKKMATKSSKSTTTTTASVAGALGGAALGALIGSAILPGIGTAIGGALGGVLGGVGGEYAANKEREKITDTIIDKYKESPEIFSSKEALEAFAQEVGMTTEELYDMRDVLADYVKNESTLDTSTEHAINQAFMAGASQDILESEQGLAFLDAYAKKTMRSESTKNKIANAGDSYTTRSGQKALLDKYELSDTGDALKNLQNIYQRLTGATLEEIEQTFGVGKEAIDELAYLIAVSELFQPQIDRMNSQYESVKDDPENYRYALAGIGKTEAIAFDGDAILLSSKDIKTELENIYNSDGPIKSTEGGLMVDKDFRKKAGIDIISYLTPEKAAENYLNSLFPNQDPNEALEWLNAFTGTDFSSIDQKTWENFVKFSSGLINDITLLDQNMNELSEDEAEEIRENMRKVLPYTKSPVQFAQYMMASQVKETQDEVLGKFKNNTDLQEITDYLKGLTEEEYLIAIDILKNEESFEDLNDFIYTTETKIIKTKVEQIDQNNQSLELGIETLSTEGSLESLSPESYQQILNTLGQMKGLYSENTTAAQEWARISNEGAISQINYLKDLQLVNSGIATSSMTDAAKRMAAENATYIGHIQTMIEERKALEAAKQELQEAKNLGNTDYKFLDSDESLNIDDEINKINAILEDTKWVIDIELPDFDDFLSIIDSVTDKMDALSNVSSKIGEGFTASIGDVEALANSIPGILENSTITKDGIVQLNKEVVKDSVNTQKKILKADYEATVAEIDNKILELEAEKATAQAKIALATGVANGEISLEADMINWVSENRDDFVQYLIDKGVEEGKANAAVTALMAGDFKTFTNNSAIEIKDLNKTINDASVKSGKSMGDFASTSGSKLRAFAAGAKAAIAEALDFDSKRSVVQAYKDAYNKALTSGSISTKEATIFDTKDGKANFNSDASYDKAGSGGNIDPYKAIIEEATADLLEIDGQIEALNTQKDTLRLKYQYSLAQLDAIGKGQSGNLGSDKGSDKGKEEQLFDASKYDESNNLLEKIDAENRKQERLQTAYNNLVEDDTATLQQLTDNLIEQEESLLAEQTLNKDLLKERKVQLNKVLSQGAQYSKYATYKDGRLVTNDALIQSLEGKSAEEGSFAAGFEEYYDNLTSAIDNLHKAEDLVADTEQELLEIRKTDAKKDFEDNRYKNSYDWLYNVMQELERLQEDQEILEKEYNAMLENRNATGTDIADNLSKQKANLEAQMRMQEEVVRLNKLMMTNLLKENEQLQKYATYDWQSGKIELNIEAIEGIVNEEEGAELEEFVSKMEELDSGITEANGILLDIEGQIENLYDEFRDDRVSLEERVWDALLQKQQDEIDRLTEIDEDINEANDKLIDSMRDSLDKMRQERENEKTEQSIVDKETRLAYLRRDTTGANQQEILQLEKELAEEKEDYTDTLIDQKLTRIEEQNEEARKQRERQIEILQEQLEYDQKNPNWDEVNRIIAESTSPLGNLIPKSELEILLQEAEDYQSMSETQKQVWADELINAVKATSQYTSEARQLEKLTDEERGVKAGGQVTFTDAEGKVHTGTYQANGDVVVTDGNYKYTYSDVYRDFDGTYKQLTTTGVKKELINKPETNKPSSSTSQKNESSSGAASQPSKENTTSQSSGGTIQKNSKVTAKASALIYDSYDDKTGETQTYKSNPNYTVLSIKNGRAQVRHISKSSGVTGWISLADLSITGSGSTGNSNSATQQQTSSYFSKPNYSGTSIVDGLKTSVYGTNKNKWPGNDAMYQKIGTLAQIASKNSITDSNAGTRNTKLLNLLKQGKLKKYKAFAHGGLVDFTGPAWLDGTRTRPEAFLSAEDTKNFMQLKDVLSGFMKTQGPSQPISNQTSFTINVQVDSISNDYDVDRMISRVKQDIMSSSHYRNVTSINLRK